MENILDYQREYTDRQQFEKLITLTYKDLYRFIYTIVRNPFLAEDVLQETLVLGYKYFDNLKDKQKFKSWIFTIAKREALRIIKMVSRECIVENDICYTIIDSDIWDFTETSSEIQEELIEIINSLDNENKDIIYLIYYADLSLEEVSEILNMNYNTLKSKHKRLKDKIYKELAKKNLVKAK